MSQISNRLSYFIVGVFMIFGAFYSSEDQYESKQYEINREQYEINREQYTQYINIVKNVSLIFPHAKETLEHIFDNIMVNNRPRNSVIDFLDNGTIIFICPPNINCEIDKNVKETTDEILQKFIVKGNSIWDEIGKKVSKQYKFLTSLPSRDEFEMIQQGSVNLFGLKYNTYVANHTIWYGEGRCVEMASYAYVDIFRKNWNDNTCIDMAFVEISHTKYEHSFILFGQLFEENISSFNHLSSNNLETLVLVDPWNPTIAKVSNIIKLKIPLYTTKHTKNIKVVCKFQCSIFENLKTFDSKYGTQFQSLFINEINNILSVFPRI